MSLEEFTLPSPPKINGGEIIIPPYYHCGHPYTKWMRNMLRCGASFRISTMIKERPELFQQFYQIPDWPDLVTNQPNDKISMFNRHSILILNPLCLAIYMKKDKSAELILKSGLNSCNDKCWATEVFSRIQSGAGDIMEIHPICIAIRREYFEVIPILVRGNPKDPTNFPKLNINERINLRYETKDVKKVFRYRDSLQYAIDTLKKRGNLHVSRMLEMFIIECSENFNPNRFDEDRDGNNVSLFNRIIKTAFYDDSDCRISMQLIQCLEILLKHKCVPWNIGIELDNTNNSSNTFSFVKDYNYSITLLLALYNKIQMRVKNGPLDNLGYLIIKTLQHVQWCDRFFQMSSEQIQMRFGKWDNTIFVPLEAIGIIRKHIKAIIELEKEREMKFQSAKPRGSLFTKKEKTHLSSHNKQRKDDKHCRSCSLKDKIKYPDTQNLLQTRKTNFVNILTTIPHTNFIKRLPEFSKFEESTPLFSYQTGMNNSSHLNDVTNKHNSENKTNENTADKNENTADKNENYSNVPDNIIDSKYFDNDNYISPDAIDICDDTSRTSSELNCLEMSPIKNLKDSNILYKNLRVTSKGDVRTNSTLVCCKNSNSLCVNDTLYDHHHKMEMKPYEIEGDSGLNVFSNSDTDDYDGHNNDDSGDLSNDYKLLELEEKLFDQLYLEYLSRKKGKLRKTSVKVISNTPVISKHNRKSVNNNKDNIS